ncbi:MAG: NAD(P)/FAD-dependent oxidoreductase [Gemmobacter sp.]
MAATPDPVVIVGAGQAGAWVAATLRAEAPGARIVMIGAEPHAPYERPPLSKGILAGKAEPASAALRPPGYWEGAGIALATGRRAVAIDRAARCVLLDDGTAEPYGTLVLTTGAEARTLDAPVDAGAPVFMLRTLDDALALGARLRPGARIVAIGAGFVGLEVAATAREAGCAVTVLEAAPAALGRVLDPTVADEIVDLHRRHGIEVAFGVRVNAIRGAPGGGARVDLADGRSIAADTVVVGIGARPCDDLARAAGIACDDGILTDAEGRTSDPLIFAAGDVARAMHPLMGRPLRLESWQNAQNQGIALGKLLAGGEAPAAEVPWFWTDQFGANFQMCGAPRAWDQVVWRGRPEDGRWSVLYLCAGRAVAGNTFDAARDMRALRRLVEVGAPVDPARFADPATNLLALMRELAPA